MTDLLLDRYEKIKPLGKGQFGRVVLAKDTKLNKLVAIKEINKLRLQK